MEGSSNKRKNNSSSNSSGDNNDATTSNGLHPACASCKHQRKKCTVDCVLAPHFPANKQSEFLAVHKVFGVCNMIKLLRNVNKEHRQTVADSLIWEALCRQKDPVLGSLGEYRKLQEELQVYKRLISGTTNKATAYGVNSGMISWNGSNGANGVNKINGSISIRTGQINNKIATYKQNNETISTNTIANPVPSLYILDQCIGNSKQEVNGVNFQQQCQAQQQMPNLISGYDQQHYISGQLGSINGRTNTSSIKWGNES